MHKVLPRPCHAIGPKAIRQQPVIKQISQNFVVAAGVLYVWSRNSKPLFSALLQLPESLYYLIINRFDDFIDCINLRAKIPDNLICCDCHAFCVLIILLRYTNSVLCLSPSAVVTCKCQLLVLIRRDLVGICCNALRLRIFVRS
jgi:hypothetical protein